MMFKKFVDCYCMGGKRSIEQYSYIPILIETLKLKTNNILEYGTGLSTELMSMVNPSAKITCVEHDWKWYKYYEYKFRNNDNVTIMHEPNLKKYSGKPLFLGLKFDLIFIDGVDRNSCLLVGECVLSSGGFVILHDANREEYKECLELFELVEERFNTILLRLKRKQRGVIKNE